MYIFQPRKSACPVNAFTVPVPRLRFAHQNKNWPCRRHWTSLSAHMCWSSSIQHNNSQSATDHMISKEITWSAKKSHDQHMTQYILGKTPDNWEIFREMVVAREHPTVTNLLIVATYLTDDLYPVHSVVCIYHWFMLQPILIQVVLRLCAWANRVCPLLFSNNRDINVQNNDVYLLSERSNVISNIIPSIHI